MKLTRNTYIGKRGAERLEPVWHVDFDYPAGTPHRLPAFSSRKNSLLLMKLLRELTDDDSEYVPDMHVVKAVLSMLPVSTVRQMMDIGVIGEDDAPTHDRLVEHLERYRDERAKAGIAKTVLVNERGSLTTLFRNLDWYVWEDVSLPALKDWFNKLPARRNKGVKIEYPREMALTWFPLLCEFARWMTATRRLERNPLAGLEEMI